MLIKLLLPFLDNFRDKLLFCEFCKEDILHIYVNVYFLNSQYKQNQAQYRKASQYLIQVFPGKECLIATHRLEDSWKSIWFLNLLPGFATAISLQSVVDNMMIMWVFSCQDAGSTRTA